MGEGDGGINQTRNFPASVVHNPDGTATTTYRTYTYESTGLPASKIAAEEGEDAGEILLAGRV